MKSVVNRTCLILQLKVKDLQFSYLKYLINGPTAVVLQTGSAVSLLELKRFNMTVINGQFLRPVQTAFTPICGCSLVLDHTKTTKNLKICCQKLVEIFGIITVCPTTSSMSK